MNLLVNMKVVSQLQVGDKLCTTSTSFKVQTAAYTTPLVRWAGSESRDSSMSALDKLVQHAGLIVSRAITSDIIKRLHPNLGENERAHIEINNVAVTQYGLNLNDNVQLLQTMLESLKSMLPGITNLIETYVDDSTTSSRLHILMDSINRLVDQIQIHRNEDKKDSSDDEV